MSALSITPPFPTFAGKDGLPLEDGYIWLGSANQNPQTNPLVAYWDETLTQIAQQPIRTLGGYPAYSGTPARLFISAAVYSILVQDKNGNTVYTSPSNTGPSTFVNFSVNEEVQVATAGQTVFTLANTYSPGTNSLTVYVDGVNQYDGSGYAFVETNGNTVTFTSGLHVGALVKFSTAIQISGGGTDSSQVTYVPAGTGAVTTTVQAKLRETVSVKDFGAVGDGVTDDTAAIQAAADAAKAEKKSLFIPAPTVSYLISSTITFNDINVYGESAADFTQFKATTEFTAFKIYASLGTIENIGIDFDLGSPATSAVGFEFASTASIFDNVRQSKFYQLNVRNAYNGFQTAASGGTIAIAVFELCRSALHTNIGFNFKASPGSTNFTLINCFSQGIVGGTSKGVILDSIKDVSLINLSIDSCLDVNLKVTDVGVLSIDNIAFEAPKLTLNNAKIIDLTNVSTNIKKINIQGLTVDVGAGNNAFIVGGGGSTYNTRIGEIRQQGTTTTSGTLFKHRPGTPSNGAYQINDSNCTYTDISYGGFDAFIVLNNRQSISSFASMLGTWVQGDFVWNRTAVEAGTTPNKYVIIGWSRLTTGSANVLNTDWVESRVLTGN